MSKQTDTIETHQAAITQAQTRIREQTEVIEGFDVEIAKLEAQETDLAVRRLTDESPELADRHAELSAIVGGKIRQREQAERERASFERVLATNQRALHAAQIDLARTERDEHEQTARQLHEQVQREVNETIRRVAIDLAGQFANWHESLGTVRAELAQANRCRDTLDEPRQETRVPHIGDLLYHAGQELSTCTDITRDDRAYLGVIFPPTTPSMGD